MKLENFHSHTSRCLHADGSDEAYVLRAIEEDFSTLGFSDHCPWPFDNKFVSPIRMTVAELDGYVDSVLGLKKKYLDQIDIFLGLECEYFPEYYPWLKEIVAAYNMDYLILGNHYHLREQQGIYYGDVTDKEMLYEYLRTTTAAVESGLFSIIAHPDMIFRNYPVFDEACEEVAHGICQLAEQDGIHLEYNLLGVYRTTAGMFDGCGYPCANFWQVCEEYKCNVIVGCDAHSPSQLDYNNCKNYYEQLATRGFNLSSDIRFLSKSSRRMI